MEQRPRDAKQRPMRWSIMLLVIIGSNAACLFIYTAMHSSKLGSNGHAPCDRVQSMRQDHGLPALALADPSGVSLVTDHLAATSAQTLPKSASPTSAVSLQPTNTAAAAAAEAAAGPRSSVSAAARRHLARCPLPGFCARTKVSEPPPGPASYLTDPPHPMVKDARDKVARFVASAGYRERVAAIQRSQHRRGILISAGGPKLLNMAAASIRILRRLNCTLPVEIAHRNPREVDNATMAFISASLGPVYWMDLSKQPWPKQQREGWVTRSKYEHKVVALYHTRFREVLMLDADSLPLRDPSYLFQSPQYRQYGNLLWTDYWGDALEKSPLVPKAQAYKVAGISEDAFKALLFDGQGPLHRTSESGQLLLDRARHADVLDFALLLNTLSFFLDMYMHGDKDTFGFAFAYAGKAHEVMHMPIPPGAVLREWQPAADSQEPKRPFTPPAPPPQGGVEFEKPAPLGGPRAWPRGATLTHVAMTQYDHLGRVAFVHLTTSKWTSQRGPKVGSYVTGPISDRFFRAFGNETINLDYPASAFRPVFMDPLDPQLNAAAKAAKEACGGPGPAAAAACRRACPLGAALQYASLRQSGLPLTFQPPELEAACFHASLALWGPFESAEDGGSSGDDGAGGSGGSDGGGSARSSGSSGGGARAAAAAATAAAAAANESRAVGMSYELAKACSAGEVSGMAGGTPCWGIDWRVAGAVAGLFAGDGDGPVFPGRIKSPNLTVPIPLLAMDLEAYGDGQAVACALRPLLADRIPEAVGWIRSNIDSMPMIKYWNRTKARDRYGYLLFPE